MGFEVAPANCYVGPPPNPRADIGRQALLEKAGVTVGSLTVTDNATDAIAKKAESAPTSGQGKVGKAPKAVPVDLVGGDTDDDDDEDDDEGDTTESDEEEVLSCSHESSPFVHPLLSKSRTKIIQDRLHELNPIRALISQSRLNEQTNTHTHVHGSCNRKNKRNHNPVAILLISPPLHNTRR